MWSYTMSISTGLLIPLSCTISIDNHSRYCSLICIVSLMIQIKVQYLIDHIIQLIAVEMRSLRSWTVIDWTWQSLCRLPLKNQDRIGCAMSSCLTQENVCLPKFQNTSLVGNFGPQIRLPDGHFGQFRAIEPMELLRSELLPMKYLDH